MAIGLKHITDCRRIASQHIATLTVDKTLPRSLSVVFHLLTTGRHLHLQTDASQYGLAVLYDGTIVLRCKGCLQVHHTDSIEGIDKRGGTKFTRRSQGDRCRLSVTSQLTSHLGSTEMTALITVRIMRDIAIVAVDGSAIGGYDATAEQCQILHNAFLSHRHTDIVT